MAELYTHYWSGPGKFEMDILSLPAWLWKNPGEACCEYTTENAYFHDPASVSRLQV
jgi:hypothetical protein